MMHLYHILFKKNMLELIWAKKCTTEPCEVLQNQNAFRSSGVISEAAVLFEVG